MNKSVPPIHTIVLSADAGQRHPHNAYRSIAEAFGGPEYAYAGRIYRAPSRFPQIMRGLVGAAIIAFALYGVMQACRA